MAIIENMKAPEGQNRPHLEIQIHLSDIQKGVRYLFLSRQQIWFGILAMVLFVCFLGFSAVVAPTVVTNFLNHRKHESLLATRVKLGDRLGALSHRLSEFGKASARLELKMKKIYMTYGLTHDDSIGQGGYPFQTKPVPSSIYAAEIAQAAAMETDLLEQIQVLETFVTEIQAFEAAHEDQVRSTPSISPLRGDDFVLTSPFGWRRSPFTKKPDFHHGIDLAAPVGTPIYAPADGEVVFAGRFPVRQSVSWWRYGNLVSIRSGGFITLFGHCDTIKVKAGRRVKQGDIIATVGNTGWSTSPHLHYEVRRRGEDGEYRPVDSRIYILDRRWRDEEKILVKARNAPELRGFEPLPRRISR